MMQGKSVQKIIDEQVRFSELSEDESAVWSLLVASGYLKIDRHYFDSFSGERVYELSLTNMEVRLMFKKMIRGWFSKKRIGIIQEEHIRKYGFAFEGKRVLIGMG